MCCAKCEHYGRCTTALTVRMHSPRTHGMPANHFHICRSIEPCEYRCHSCALLVSSWGTLPKTNLHYGCCHRCSEYTKCIDFVAQHAKQAKTMQAKCKKTALGWQYSFDTYIRQGRNISAHQARQQR